jgi:hypothetical protein
VMCHTNGDCSNGTTCQSLPLLGVTFRYCQ